MGIADLWRGERGFLALAIIVAATVLVALNKMPVANWEQFVMGIFIAFAAAKTTTTVAGIIKGTKGTPSPEPIAPTTVEVSGSVEVKP